MLVYAQYVLLTVYSGHLNVQLPEAEAALGFALDAGEMTVAARLANALSYNRLSHGDFNRATHFARQSSALAEK